MIAGLNLKFWIGCLNVTIEFILWNSKQSWRWINRIIFEMRVIHLRSIAAIIAAGAGKRQGARAALPLSIRRIGNEIVNHGVDLDYVDICPKRVARRIT